MTGGDELKAVAAPSTVVPRASRSVADLPPSQIETEAVVAGLLVLTGQGQIADPGQPDRRSGIAAVDLRHPFQLAQARAMSAERALAPKPMPSEQPQAMATTFFIAPQICTPTVSLLA